MGENLVEQQDRRRSSHLAQQSSMRKHQPYQKRFLLAGRRIRGGNALYGMDHFHIAQMWPVERAPSGGVAVPIVAQHHAVALFDLTRRIGGDELLQPAV